MSVRLAVLAAAVLASLVSLSRARADNPVLVATVGQGDGFNITLVDAAGTRVTHLDAGTYTIRVHDLSEIHDFHLFGPGVSESTAVENKEEATWTVTLTDGTYTYQCDPHRTVMHGSFTVGTVSTPPPPTALKALVGPGRRIALRTASGSRVTLFTGTTRVVVAVVDNSRSDNFRLRGPGINRATGIRARGRTSWHLTLKPGVYRYRSDAHRTLRGTFTVTGSGARA
jgi:plastocyanin